MAVDPTLKRKLKEGKSNATGVRFQDLRWVMDVCQSISPMNGGEALKELMELRCVTIFKMVELTGFSMATVKRLRDGKHLASVEQIAAIAVALELHPRISSELLKKNGISIDFNNEKNIVYNEVLTEYYNKGMEDANEFLKECGYPVLKGEAA